MEDSQKIVVVDFTSRFDTMNVVQFLHSLGLSDEYWEIIRDGGVLDCHQFVRRAEVVIIREKKLVSDDLN